MPVQQLAATGAEVERAVRRLARGEGVVLVDDVRGVGELVFAAEHATTEMTAFAVRHGSGHLGVALTARACTELRLPPAAVQDDLPSSQRVSVDLVGRGTGISAADRAATIAALADPTHDPTRFTRPGHVVPYRVPSVSLPAHPTFAEAAQTLAVLAPALCPATAFTVLVSADRPAALANEAELRTFADEHDLALVTVSELLMPLPRSDAPTYLVDGPRCTDHRGDGLGSGW
ncbi:3,4-dihydroxy-2-butanone-4-phosphate synthase [Actinomycetospora lemnae]|uniref:3,4-dihydroxy-2-butanone-4-phosphate synthase n=1 Tax=Actinomycetospora lemnae TaxID=3019891 RepID=A0ABT5SRK3_9PSEU|nr:3,4-dihydroxy-2-butanone-4-phosphate synthase [Actinomycetospora sp. DW7H6]MDD7965468.1 3,4-dihydroxy-2-butanone-4-phosphate synthase [Actinomycetospora sp. DW7H6]